MYSWGGSTADWKKPGGYSFDSARAPYLDKLAAGSAAKGGRSYLGRTSPDAALVGTKDKVIKTDSENPIVVGIDVTGSMRTWPAEIFDRLPLLYQTLSQYRPDVEISFGAIGDANSDRYPIQVNNFGKGLDLEEHINALYPEGRGGGQVSESYELFGYFMQNKCEMPKAKSPFLIIFGDEKFYDEVDPRQVAYYIGDKLQTPLDSKALWDGILQKFNFYLLHKAYGHGNVPTTDAEVKQYWADAIGSQRIIELPSAERAVDIAIGIIAKQWGEYGDFSKSLDSRQTDPAVIASVHNPLRFLPDPNAAGSNSVIDSKSTAARTKSLLDPDGGDR